ncbi:MAG: PAS domain S-box protein [Candidatus Aminicenantales bacterium]
MTKISSRFINLASERIENGIHHALAQIGRFVGADRCSFYLKAKGEKTARTYAWNARGIEAWVHNWRGLCLESFPWWADKISRFEPVLISRLSDLAEREAVKREFLRAHRIRSLLIVPVEKGRLVTGFFGLDTVRKEIAWHSNLIPLLKLVGEILLNALERERAEEIIRKRSTQLELIHHIQNEIPLDESVENILVAAAETMGRAFGYYKISVNLFDPNTQEIVYLTGWNKTGLPLPQGHRQKLGEGLIGKAALLRQTIVANDVSKEPDYIPFHLTRTKAELVIPLLVRERLVGVLDLQATANNAFSEDDVIVLQSLARYIAHVLDSRQKEGALRESLEKYRTIIENIQEGYYEVDLAGNFTFTNDSLCRMLGYPMEKVLGMNNREYMEEESARRIYRVFNQVFKTGQPVSLVELEAMTADGKKHHAEFSVSLIKDSNGQPAGFRGIVRDVTERKRAEQALVEANTRLEALLEAIPDVVYFKDAQRRNLIFNTAFEKLCRLPREEIIGRKDEELLPADLAEYCRRSDEEVIKGGKPLRFEESAGPDGEKIYFETIKAPIFGPRGKPIGLVGVSRDITERKIREEALRASEEKFRLLAQNAHDIIYRYELIPERRFSYVSPAAFPITGYTPEEHYADPDLGLKMVHPDDRHFLRSMFDGKIDADQPMCLRWLRKDGTIIWTEQRNAPIYDEAGRLVAIEGIVRDVTERKRAEEKIKASLREKEVLLREIHHRVKNNLQVISSLLNLQSRTLSDPAVLKLFRECQNRVRSMALVHEKLYQSQDLSRINFADYIRNLSIHLFHVHQVDSSRVQLKQELEDIQLDINTAIPCGLILNELVSNCLKHAFSDGRSGEVRIQLKRQDGENLLLVVSDNGVGLPESLDIEKTSTLGLQILTLLVKQLDAVLELRRQPGTEFRILFRELKYAQRT